MLLNEKMWRLRELLIHHEGIRLKPYVCSAGKITIGVGRNLQDVGITEFEAMQLLTNDIERVQREAVSAFPWFKSLCIVRQDVVLDMLFNLGIHRFKGFKKMISCLVVQNYVEAAHQMLDSNWAKQVGNRAQDLASMMRSGTYVCFP